MCLERRTTKVTFPSCHIISMTHIISMKMFPLVIWLRFCTALSERTIYEQPTLMGQGGDKAFLPGVAASILSEEVSQQGRGLVRE